MFKIFIGRVPWVAIVGSLIGILFVSHLLSFIPGPDGRMGVDWQFFLPWLLDGYYGAQANGTLSVQWFTPSFCGGIPKFPDPQDQYFSLAQFFVFFTSPVVSARISVALFALVGFVGGYLLLRRRFGFGTPASLAGGTVFLCNGYFSGGMVAGHLVKQPYMLIPLIAYFLFGAARKGRALSESLALAGGASVCMAYTIWAGAAVLLPVMLFAAAGLAFFLATVDEDFGLKPFFAAFFLSVFFAMALAAAKLSATLYYASWFSRDFYQLPGAETLSGLFKIVIHSLFGSTTAAVDVPLKGLKWDLEPNEFDYGVTWAPLLFVGFAFVWRMRRGPETNQRKISPYAYVGLAMVLLVPLALNFYAPAWNHFLKMLPVIKSSSSNLKWLGIYVPLVAAFTAAVLDGMPTGEHAKTLLGVLCALAVLALTLASGKREGQIRLYNPERLETAYNLAVAQRQVPPVDRIELSDTVIGKNDIFIYGASSMRCYQPIFGYYLEKLPFKTLAPGPVMKATEGALNLKNPACYVFPAENGCMPGDHFTANEFYKAWLLSKHRQYEFILPWQQRAADWITATAWLFWCGTFAFYVRGRFIES